MAKNKTLPSIRISSNTHEQIVLAMNKFNQNSIINLTLQDFRRLAYLYLSRHILSGKPLDIKLER